MDDENAPLRGTTIALAEIITELREYRKTLHERFGHLHERLGDLDKRADDVHSDLDRLRSEITTLLERHLVAQAIDHEKLAARVVKLEDFHIVIRTNWKALVTVASSLSILIGWLLTHFGPSVAHALDTVAGV